MTKLGDFFLFENLGFCKIFDFMLKICFLQEKVVILENKVARIRSSQFLSDSNFSINFTFQK